MTVPPSRILAAGVCLAFLGAPGLPAAPELLILRADLTFRQSEFEGNSAAAGPEDSSAPANSPPAGFATTATSEAKSRPYAIEVRLTPETASELMLQRMRADSSSSAQPGTSDAFARLKSTVPGKRFFQRRWDATETRLKNAGDAASQQRLKRELSDSFRSDGPEGFFSLELAPGDDQEALLAELRARPGVVYAEPSYPRRPAAAPNDTLYSRQWYVDAINAEAAWDVIGNKLAEEVTVAVIDTGVRIDHEELAGRVSHFVDVYRTNGDAYANTNPDDDDTDGHGTSCAGIIMAKRDNGRSIAGLAPVRLIAINGGGLNANDEVRIYNTVEGIYTAVDLGADVISMSLGGEHLSRGEADAAAYAESEGVVIVAAAGNDDASADDQYPAAISTVVSVGAVDDRLRRVRRPTWPWGSNFGDTLDIVAPGQASVGSFSDSILTIDSGSNSATRNRFNGTSAATPQVAAVAAMVRMVNPDLTPAEVREILFATARDQVGASSEDTPGFDRYHGHGLLDAEAAVLYTLGIPDDPTTFVLRNTGNTPLKVEALFPAQAAPWVSVDLQLPAIIAPGENLNIPVSVDFSRAPTGSTTVFFNLQTNAPGATLVANALRVLTVRDGLADMLDTPGRTWRTGGDAPWTGTFTKSYDGIDGAVSGPIGDNQESWIETTVNGPADVTFRWSVSSENSYDRLRFSIDGVQQDSLSGSPGWRTKTVELAEATSYRLRWTYDKDYSVSRHDDAGYLDALEVLTLAEDGLDIDGNGTISISYDLVLWTRYAFGFRGNDLVAAAVGPGAKRTSAAEIEGYLAVHDDNGAFDIDGDGNVLPDQDGYLVLRYLAGLRGADLARNLVSQGAQRATPEALERYLATLAPHDLIDETGLPSSLLAVEAANAGSPHPRTQNVQPEREIALGAPTATLPIAFSYATSDSNAGTSGLGLRLHFDSQMLAWQGCTPSISSDFLACSRQPMVDPEAGGGYDGDSETDRYILIAWFAFDGAQWPGASAEAPLFEATFSPLHGFEGMARLRLSAVRTASGYTFDSDAVKIHAPPQTYNSWAALTIYPYVHASKWGPEDDADGDGQINLFEYAQFTDPADARSLREPFSLLNSGPFVDRDGQRYTVDFRVSRFAADADIVLQYSEDLLHWQDVEDITLRGQSPEHNVMRGSLEHAAPELFFRTFVQKNP
ncbi:MAG: S8 family serine peptidase [Opitutales bacterium]